jgi:hypothetical protein
VELLKGGAGGVELILMEQIRNREATYQQRPGHDIQQSFQDDTSRGGSDAISALVIRPTWSRFSPGKLAGGEGRRGGMTPSRR